MLIDIDDSSSYRHRLMWASQLTYFDGLSALDTCVLSLVTNERRWRGNVERFSIYDRLVLTHVVRGILNVDMTK